MLKPEQEYLLAVFEAIIFSANRPLSIKEILEVFDEEERPAVNLAKLVLKNLQEKYLHAGVQLVETASGFRFIVNSDYMGYFSKLWNEKPAKYSRATLETLALIAYRQPITRSEIEEIRGVSVSPSILKTLEEREWIKVVGHKEVPGKPALYATTKYFLDDLGIKSIADLPPLPVMQDVELNESVEEKQVQLTLNLEETAQT